MSYPVSLGRVLYLTAYRSDLQFQLSQIYTFIRQLATTGLRLQPQSGGADQDPFYTQWAQANQARVSQMNKAAEQESELIKAKIQAVSTELEQAVGYVKKGIEEIKSLSFNA